MSLRDLVLFGAMAVLAPLILAHPYIGALTWVFFGIMNPHRLTWGAAFGFQFSLVIAVLTIVGLAFTREHRQVKGGGAGVVLILFTVWICITAFFPLNPVDSFVYWERVMKNFLMTGVLLLLLHTKRHVELLVWMMVIALGFYGVKGGIFTILGGGQFLVWGPAGSAIEGNNALGVGLVVVIPLMVHLYRQHRKKWLRLGLAGAALLCAVSVLGTYSRGALLAVFAMGCLLWVRSEHKMPIFVGAMLVAMVAITAMPERWEARMRTIETYKEDSSAMSRLISWETAYNVAKDRFPLGGGFEWNTRETYLKYSPDPMHRLMVAHSIYFQVIGSQGFIGLGFFLLFWWLVWRQCGWIRRKSRDQSELRWAHSLASMTQVSLVGYAVGGAFLDLAFWDLPYYLYVVVAVTQYTVTQELALPKAGAPAAPTPREAASDGARIYPAG